MIAAVQRMPAEVAFVIFTRVAFLAALVVLLAIVSPHFLTTDNMVIVLRQAALQFLMAAGLTMVVLTGGIDLSVGAVLGLGACLGAGFIASGSVLMGVAAALGAGLACGLVNGALAVAVLRNGLNLIGLSTEWQVAVVGLVIVCAVAVDALRNRP